VSSLVDLTGEKFGRLTVLYRDVTVTGKAMWYCECDCGKISRVQTYDLRRTDSPVRSCGCLRKFRTSRKKIENKKRELINKRRGIICKKGPRTLEQKKLNAEASIAEKKWHNHYEGLINKPCKTLKTFRLYDDQQSITIIMEDIRNIEEVQMPLGVHKYSTIITRKASGKPGLLEYNVIETKKQIMDVSKINELV
jgi:hypothetical protein